MAYVAIALILCFMLWKWTRKTALGLGILVACIAVAALLSDFAGKKAESTMGKIAVSMEKSASCPADAPLAMTIENGTEETLYKYEVEIKAKKPGHSDIYNYGATPAYYPIDLIVAPKERKALCVKTPALGYGVSPDDVVFEARVTHLLRKP